MECMGGKIREDSNSHVLLINSPHHNLGTNLVAQQ